MSFLSRASIYSACLFSTHTDTVFQTAPSSETSNPTLFRARRKERGKIHAFSFEYTPATTSQKLETKKRKTKTKTQKKQREAQTFHRVNRRRQGTKLKTHTHTQRHALTHARTHARLPDTQLTLTDKHTKKQQTQSPAQPEVYFMQKYSKVCFTIQLNIKGGYIPL